MHASVKRSLAAACKWVAVTVATITTSTLVGILYSYLFHYLRS